MPGVWIVSFAASLVDTGGIGAPGAPWCERR